MISNRTMILMIFTLIVSLIIFGGCSSGNSQTPATIPDSNSIDNIDSPSANKSIDAKVLIESSCGECHSTGTVFNASMSADEWDFTIDRMIAKGAPEMTSEQKQAIIDYLTGQ
ncbi:MAG: hypothetical protein JXA19_06975 [Anaerolineales bacterium]|nr:hypothetical protein [Anaerolineales bacterium]